MTSTSMHVQSVYYRVTIETADGRTGTVLFTPGDFERYKRGMALISGGFVRCNGWDNLTQAQRDQYEADAEWLGSVLDKVKLRRDSSAANA
jgi:hypothetical protein